MTIKCMSKGKNIPGARGNAGFSMPFLVAIFCSCHLVFFSHLGERIDDYGTCYRDTISYFSSEFFCVKGENQHFYIGGFANKEVAQMQSKYTKGEEIRFWAVQTHKGKSIVLRLINNDGYTFEYSWWRWNLYVLVIDCVAILLIPIVLIERKRVMREYGPTADPSIWHDIKEIFRRYQKPHIDDK